MPELLAMKFGIDVTNWYVTSVRFRKHTNTDQENEGNKKDTKKKTRRVKEKKIKGWEETRRRRVRQSLETEKKMDIRED